MSSIPYQVALADELVLTNPQGILEISASQVTEQRYSANSQSLSQIQFQNIKSTGANSLFDAQAYLEYECTVSADLSKGQLLPGLLFTHTTTVAAMTVAIDNQVQAILTSNVTANTFQTNIGNIAFRQLPLSRCTSALQISINNANSMNYNLQNELALQDPLSEEAKEALSGFCAVDSPRSVVVPNFYTLDVPANASSAMDLIIDTNYKGGQKQPNNQWWNNGRNLIKATAVSAVAASGVYSATYKIREPVLADPFSVGYSGPALCNVSSLTITYSLDSSTYLSGMFCATRNFMDTASGSPTLTGLAVTNITGCVLVMRTFAVDPSVVTLPEICYYDYSQYQFNQTPCSNVVINSSATVTTNSMGLPTVPRLYILKIQQNPNGLSPLPQAQIGAQIQSITINYGNIGRFIFTSEQLYQAFIRNTKAVKNYNEWLADCVVVLNPALDLVNNASSFTGMSGMGALTMSTEIQYNCNNYYYGGTTNIIPIPGNLYAQEMFIYSGSVAIGQSQAIYNTTTISSGQLVAALDKPLVSNKALKNAHGLRGATRAGSLFGSIGNVLRGAVSALPGLVNTAAGVTQAAQGVLQHPMVQSALGALGGQGGALMYSSRRGRR
jgi:hypothetical protein